MTPADIERLARDAGLLPTLTENPHPPNAEQIGKCSRFAALVRAESAADLAQALCDDCESGVKWLNESAAAKFAKDYPHLRAAIRALGDTK